ncbi:MAG TPA: aldo/keto reductase, partial [Caulobacter sp.]|nr:aldo/keto reductase [Caulobacter sp.]
GRCRALGGDLSLVALQFALQTASQAGLVSTVVGMSQPEILRRNIAALATPIDPEILTAARTALAPVKDLGWDLLPGAGGKAGA